MRDTFVVFRQDFYFGKPEAAFETREEAEEWVKEQGAKVLTKPGDDNGYRIKWMPVR